jgi:hypothetical protein
MLFWIIFLGIVGVLTGRFALRAWRARSMAPLVEAGRGAMAGVLAGIVWGVGARLVMRLVALADGRPTEFSAGGTLLIVIVGMIFGLLLGLLFATVRRWLPGSRLAGGAAFGSIIAGLLMLPLAALGAADLGGDPADAPVLIGTGLFGALFVVHGVVMAALCGPVSRGTVAVCRPHARRHRPATGGATIYCIRDIATCLRRPRSAHRPS